jgi:transketolase
MADAPARDAATFSDLATAIRVLSMEAVEKATCGHPGMPMGMADVATVLFTRFLKYDAAAPNWPDRDRFVLSAGHGSMLLYSLLHLTGYAGVTAQEIANFRQWGAKTPGHPEYGHTPGVETTTGPLGQGLGNAVGMAMAERHLASRFGTDLVDHRTWVIAGDGCLMEGISHEAIGLAGRFRLNKLTVLWDDNDVTIDGRLSVSETGDQLARFKAFGWAVKRINGHDEGQIRRALAWATRQSMPTLIACQTKIGRGAATLEGNPKTHGAVLGAAEIAATRQKLGWTLPPFEVPAATAAKWKSAGRRGRAPRKAWEARLAASPQGAAFTAAVKGELPAGAFDALQAEIARLVEARPAAATRDSTGAALETLTPAIPEMVGGSADLTGSNNTYVKDMVAFDAPDYAGRYVHWGIREHGMAAAMNGMALHGGIIPYSGTFLVFSDYMRPSIRLAALMGIRVIHVLTHDSIGLGEDGPTHQPVEHLAALRAIPNLYVFRPADALETAECWRAALELKASPSVMALSRQKTTAARIEASPENLSAKGAYELRAAKAGLARVTIFASGTEVEIALAARDQLEAEGIGARVVSTPCWELFEQQPEAYRAQVIGTTPVRVAVEAAVRLGWERFLGEHGVFVGMTSFGASAPAEKLYAAFGITPEAVVAAAKAKLG